MFVSSRSGIKRYKKTHTLSKVGDPDIMSISMFDGEIPTLPGHTVLHQQWCPLYSVWALVFHHDCLAGGCEPSSKPLDWSFNWDYPRQITWKKISETTNWLWLWLWWWLWSWWWWWLLLLFISYRKKTHNLIIQLQDVTGNSAPNRSVLG